jgi:hypothetical protein
VQAAHGTSKEQRSVLEALGAVLKHSSVLALQQQRSRPGRQLLQGGASNSSAAAAAAVSGAGGAGVNSQGQGQPDEMAVSGPSSSWQGLQFSVGLLLFPVAWRKHAAVIGTSGLSELHVIAFPNCATQLPCLTLDVIHVPLLLLLQGYLAALVSAVASLETSTAALNASTLALGPLLNSTFGAAAAQAEASGAAAATTAYQVGAMHIHLLPCLW